MIWSAEEIKEDIDLQIYGWDMRLLQLDENMNILRKEYNEYKIIYDGLIEKKQRINDANNS